VIIYAMFKSNQPINEQKFVERKETASRKHITRMRNELTKLGFAVSLPA
jgi:hypothetical protein